MGNLKKRLFEILEVAAPGDIPSRICDTFIMGLIIANVIAVMLATMPPLKLYRTLFDSFEVFSVVVFTIEYVLRIWTCTINDTFRHPIRGRLRFAVTPLAMIDLLAILPFYLEIILPAAKIVDLRALRALRLFRVFRLFKLSRYVEAMQLLGKVLRAKKEELYVTLFILLILLVISASLMYFIENQAQPDVFSSILDAIWWSVVTLTTVGYGDVYPITPIGKLLGAIIALLGIGFFALPTGILSSGLIEELRRQRRTAVGVCPHCKHKIDRCPHCGEEIREIELTEQ